LPPFPRVKFRFFKVRASQFEEICMFERELAATMVATGKGILAIDESGGTIKKRFDTIGGESNVESHRAYRDLPWMVIYWSVVSMSRKMRCALCSARSFASACVPNLSC
jgi:fructose-bisphosphate aldolase class 1